MKMKSIKSSLLIGVTIINLIVLIDLVKSHSLIKDLRLNESGQCELNGLILEPGERKNHPDECLQVVCFRDGSGRAKVNYCPWDPDAEYLDTSVPYPKCCKLKEYKSSNSNSRRYFKTPKSQSSRAEKQLQQPRKSIQHNAIDNDVDDEIPIRKPISVPINNVEDSDSERQSVEKNSRPTYQSIQRTTRRPVLTRPTKSVEISEPEEDLDKDDNSEIQVEIKPTYQTTRRPAFTRPTKPAIIDEPKENLDKDDDSEIQVQIKPTYQTIQRPTRRPAFARPTKPTIIDEPKENLDKDDDSEIQVEIKPTYQTIQRPTRRPALTRPVKPAVIDEPKENLNKDDDSEIEADIDTKSSTVVAPVTTETVVITTRRPLFTRPTTSTVTNVSNEDLDDSSEVSEKDSVVPETTEPEITTTRRVVIKKFKITTTPSAIESASEESTTSAPLTTTESIAEKVENKSDKDEIKESESDDKKVVEEEVEQKQEESEPEKELPKTEKPTLKPISSRRPRPVTEIKKEPQTESTTTTAEPITELPIRQRRRKTTTIAPVTEEQSVEEDNIESNSSSSSSGRNKIRSNRAQNLKSYRTRKTGESSKNEIDVTNENYPSWFKNKESTPPTLTTTTITPISTPVLTTETLDDEIIGGITDRKIPPRFKFKLEEDESATEPITLINSSDLNISVNETSTTTETVTEVKQQLLEKQTIEMINDAEEIVPNRNESKLNLLEDNKSILDSKISEESKQDKNNVLNSEEIRKEENDLDQGQNKKKIIPIEEAKINESEGSADLNKQINETEIQETNSEDGDISASTNLENESDVVISSNENQNKLEISIEDAIVKDIIDTLPSTINQFDDSKMDQESNDSVQKQLDEDLSVSSKADSNKESKIQLAEEQLNNVEPTSNPESDELQHQIKITTDNFETQQQIKVNTDDFINPKDESSISINSESESENVVNNVDSNENNIIEDVQQQQILTIDPPLVTENVENNVLNGKSIDSSLIPIGLDEVVILEERPEIKSKVLGGMEVDSETTTESENVPEDVQQMIIPIIESAPAIENVEKVEKKTKSIDFSLIPVDLQEIETLEKISEMQSKILGGIEITAETTTESVISKLEEENLVKESSPIDSTEQLNVNVEAMSNVEDSSSVDSTQQSNVNVASINITPIKNLEENNVEDSSSVDSTQQLIANVETTSSTNSDLELKMNSESSKDIIDSDTEITKINLESIEPNDLLQISEQPSDSINESKIESEALENQLSNKQSITKIEWQDESTNLETIEGKEQLQTSISSSIDSSKDNEIQSVTAEDQLNNVVPVEKLESEEINLPNSSDDLIVEAKSELSNDTPIDTVAESQVKVDSGIESDVDSSEEQNINSELSSNTPIDIAESQIKQDSKIESDTDSSEEQTLNLELSGDSPSDSVEESQVKLDSGIESDTDSSEQQKLNLELSSDISKLELPQSSIASSSSSINDISSVEPVQFLIPVQIITLPEEINIVPSLAHSDSENELIEENVNDKLLKRENTQKQIPILIIDNDDDDVILNNADESKNDSQINLEQQKDEPVFTNDELKDIQQRIVPDTKFTVESELDDGGQQKIIVDSFFDTKNLEKVIDSNGESQLKVVDGDEIKNNVEVKNNDEDTQQKLANDMVEIKDFQKLLEIDTTNQKESSKVEENVNESTDKQIETIKNSTNESSAVLSEAKSTSKDLNADLEIKNLEKTLDSTEKHDDVLQKVVDINETNENVDKSKSSDTIATISNTEIPSTTAGSIKVESSSKSELDLSDITGTDTFESSKEKITNNNVEAKDIVASSEFTKDRIDDRIKETVLEKTEPETIVKENIPNESDSIQTTENLEQKTVSEPVPLLTKEIPNESDSVKVIEPELPTKPVNPQNDIQSSIPVFENIQDSTTKSIDDSNNKQSFEIPLANIDGSVAPQSIETQQKTLDENAELEQLLKELKSNQENEFIVQQRTTDDDSLKELVQALQTESSDDLQQRNLRNNDNNVIEPIYFREPGRYRFMTEQ